jgi:hypothetical protein
MLFCLALILLFLAIKFACKIPILNLVCKMFGFIWDIVSGIAGIL